MNASEAKAVASFLGDKYTHSGGGFWVLADDDSKPAMSDADLLLACLERAAQLGLDPVLTTHANGWSACLGWDNDGEEPLHEGGGPTPLAAMVAAIVAYQESKP